MSAKRGSAFWALLCLLSGCASYQQLSSEVYLRKSGETLQPWLSVRQASEQHWPFAWAAVAAYQDADDPYREPLQTSADCPEPHAFLHDQGWTRWRTLPVLKSDANDAEQSLVKAMREAHLRAEVWENPERKMVIVAFGGTAFRNLQDWKANLHWFLSPFGARDQYDAVTEIFVPAFLTEYRERSARAEHSWLRQARIVPVGHSLGGGLAQRFAYSIPPDAGLPRINQVYTFDTSPVSAKHGAPYFVENGKDLTILRIYNRGEILASLRSILHWANPKDTDEQGQTWLDVRYLDDWSLSTLTLPGSIHSHGMFSLACFMKTNLDPSELRAPQSTASAPPVNAAPGG